MPISDCEVRDPRIRRTRQLLQSALKTLMLTRSLDEISVQDITDAAQLNRATFYDHYTDKFALLNALVAGGFHQLLHERNVRFDLSCPEAAGAIILAVCDYLVQTHSGGECTRQRAFEPLTEAAIVAAIRRVLLEGVSQRAVEGILSPEMIANTASWAIYGAVKEWFYSADRPPAEVAVPQILNLILPILAAQGESLAVGQLSRS
ncbi:MAG TPA: TetR family transcriptional regulator [Acidobacteriaceae bacterium]|nr:TetR family transcriptional regulator [Acidobacteriaceae bacterium]